MKELTEYEPSSCRCAGCVDQCCSAPGILAPGDLERIAAYVGADAGEGGRASGFASVNFEAVEPMACIEVSDNENKPHVDELCGKVPWIRPRRHASGIRAGRCVFLTDDDRCSVYSVRPFGCAVCNACEGGNAAAVDSCLVAIANDLVYLEMWTEIDAAKDV